MKIDNDCMLCNSREKKIIAKRAKFNMRLNNVVCLNCGFIYQSPRLSDDFLKSYYADSNYLEKNYNGSIKDTFNNMARLSKSRLNYLEKNKNRS
jgi:hypothetical protein